MVLAFTPRPICHPFAPTKPLGPSLSCLSKVPPPSRITRPSAELQPTCWFQGQLGFRCRNKNQSFSQSFNDCETIGLASLSPLLSAYLSLSIFPYLTCPYFFVARFGRSVELRLSFCWSHTRICGHLFTARMLVIPCQVTKLSRHKRTLVINYLLTVKTSDYFSIAGLF